MAVHYGVICRDLEGRAATAPKLVGQMGVEPILSRAYETRSAPLLIAVQLKILRIGTGALLRYLSRRLSASVLLTQS